MPGEQDGVGFLHHLRNRQGAAGKEDGHQGLADPGNALEKLRLMSRQIEVRAEIVLARPERRLAHGQDDQVGRLRRGGGGLDPIRGAALQGAAAHDRDFGVGHSGGQALVERHGVLRTPQTRPAAQQVGGVVAERSDQGDPAVRRSQRKEAGVVLQQDAGALGRLARQVGAGDPVHRAGGGIRTVEQSLRNLIRRIRRTASSTVAGVTRPSARSEGMAR